jgi:hypothetical protein
MSRVQKIGLTVNGTVSSNGVPFSAVNLSFSPARIWAICSANNSPSFYHSFFNSEMGVDGGDMAVGEDSVIEAAAMHWHLMIAILQVVYTTHG